VARRARASHALVSPLVVWYDATVAAHSSADSPDTRVNAPSRLSVGRVEKWDVARALPTLRRAIRIVSAREAAGLIPTLVPIAVTDANAAANTRSPCLIAPQYDAVDALCRPPRPPENDDAAATAL
jgi:hypothetical protein